MTDVAVLLSAMTGVDENDPVTQTGAALAGVDFTQYLPLEAAKELRLGIIVSTDEDIEDALDQFGLKGDPGEGAETFRNIYRANNESARQTGKMFSDLGFEVVEVSGSALPASVDVNNALTYGYKDAINRFLAGMGDQVEVGSLEEIIALNKEDMANRAPTARVTWCNRRTRR